MASIKKIQGAKGASYKITVTTGRNSNGKQIRHYKTWTPDRPMTAKQAEKEARQIAAQFEREIESGFVADDKQTFEQYALYVLDVKKQEGASLGTINLYERILKTRVFPEIGFLRLRDIKPQQLTALYRDLGKPGKTRRGMYAAPKPAFYKLVKEHPLNKKQLAAEIGVKYDAFWKLTKREGKRTTFQIAEQICEYFKQPFSKLFSAEGGDITLSAGYIRDIHRTISTIFAQAEKEMILQYNPAKRATIPADTDPEPKYFQPQEIRQILDALETEPIMWRTLVNLMIVTGCRRGEIAGLRWEKVDFESGQILIDCSLKVDEKTGELYEGTTKTRNKRYINIPAETVSMLKKYRMWQTEERLRLGDQWVDSGYIFTYKNGEKMNPTNIYTWVSRFSKRRNLPHINPHAFRHTAASILISEGVDIVTVSKLLGHSKPSTTADVYAHAVEDTQKKATECLTDILLRKERA